MNILWIVNSGTPEYFKLIGKKASPYGGWLDGLSNFLADANENSLSIIVPDSNLNKVIKMRGQKITYYGVPNIAKWPLKKAQSLLLSIIKEVKANIVDIHGTENFHSYALATSCVLLKIPFVVTIQGLVGAYSQHLTLGLPPSVITGKTFRDLLRGNLTVDLQKHFLKLGDIEKKTILCSKNIIGRTSFDYAVTKQINSKANYFHCEESLRENFYNKKWNISKCVRHTIFLSQGNYPIKGAHIAFKALEYLLKDYPDTKLIISGKNITKNSSIIEKLKLTKYGKYLINLKERTFIRGHVQFTGELDANQMENEYLKSNVFLCPSTIENSPNSLGEALLLGVPSVSSYVGGVPDMVEHNKNGLLYQTDAAYMLAYQISRIFDDDSLALNLSSRSREIALDKYNLLKNSNNVMSIYKEVIKNNELNGSHV